MERASARQHAERLLTDQEQGFDAERRGLAAEMERSKAQLAEREVRSTGR
jgi:hypothetical protein